MNGKQKWRIRHRATASNSCPELSMTEKGEALFYISRNARKFRKAVANTEWR